MDDQGSVVAESRHYPYGEERWRWPQEGTFPTDYRVTGQRSDGGFHGHHLITTAVSPWNKWDAPAIQMDPVDHTKTASYGQGGVGYRSAMEELVNAGRIRDALAMEIPSIRGGFGSKYNGALREALEYAKSAGFLNRR